MNEIWKDVKDYEGIYEVSSYGKVRNVVDKHILKPGLTSKGYYNVILCKNKLHKGISIHRLVALNFIPNPENKKQVNYINGIKTDNRVENLEWTTASENIKHSYKMGLQPIKWNEQIKEKIAKNHRKKIKNLDKNLIFNSITEASKICNISFSCISNCLHKRIDTAGGYHWEFI